jgi:hypothetical protein
MIRGFVFVFGYLLHFMFGRGLDENIKRFYALSAKGAGQVQLYIYK